MLAFSFRVSKGYALIFRVYNSPGLFLSRRQVFALFNLEILIILAYSLRDHMVYALFNLGTLTVLAHSFRDSKSFALFNLEISTVLAYSFRDSTFSHYLI